MSLVKSFLAPLAFIAATQAASLTWNNFLSYDNEFVPPEYILSKPWEKNNATLDAAESIVTWADTLYTQGPWSVTYKPFPAPTGDKHDYMSWAPYWWPDCSKVGNKTALKPEEVWVTCPYVDRDGQFVPDVRLINDTGSYAGMCDAVFYNSIAWQITGNNKYADKAIEFIRTWFYDEATGMNPNLNFSQVIRGPQKQTGSHYGVLDMKTISKVATGIFLFRETKYTGWTSEDDSKMTNWSKEFIYWLENSDFGKDEGATPNNHGTFFYNTLVTHKIIAGDIQGAKDALNKYFTTLYLAQIDGNGEQPFEVERSRTYHYRAYNLGAMITAAKLGQYIGFDAWQIPTTKGGTIEKAAAWALQFDPAATNEIKSAPAPELYQHVAAVAAAYGDPEGKYAAFLEKVDPKYPQSPYFFWNQPLALPKAYVVTGVLPTVNSTGGGEAGEPENAGMHGAVVPTLAAIAAVVFFQLARPRV